MTYTLQRLAPDSFDLLLGGKVVGSIVRDVSKDGYEGDWIVETLTESMPYPAPIRSRAREATPARATAGGLDNL